VRPWCFYIPLPAASRDGLPGSEQDIFSAGQYDRAWQFVKKYAGPRFKVPASHAPIPMFESKFAATLLMMTQDCRQPCFLVQVKMPALLAAKVLAHVPNQLTPVWLPAKEMPARSFQYVICKVRLMTTVLPDSMTFEDYLHVKKSSMQESRRKRTQDGSWEVVERRGQFFHRFSIQHCKKVFMLS